MHIAQIMSADPLTVSPETSPVEAYELMAREDIRHLPVVADGKLLGVLSDRDLLEVLGSSAQDAPSPETPDRVSDLMSVQPMSVTPEDSVVTATVAFLVHRVGCLPVLDEGKLVGILTEMDMAAAYERLVKQGRVVTTDEPVDKLMSRELQLAQTSDTLAGAWQEMTSRHVRHLPVVDGANFVGLVSDRDLRRGLGDGARDDAALSTIMSSDALHVKAGTPVAEAAFRMTLSKVSALPVLKDGKLVGLVTLTDVLEHCLEHLRSPEHGDAN